MVPHASITIANCPTVIFKGKGPVWSHGLHTAVRALSWGQAQGKEGAGTHLRHKA